MQFYFQKKKFKKVNNYFHSKQITIITIITIITHWNLNF